MEKYLLPASLIILWLHLDKASSASNVEQNPQSLHVQEGKSTNFTCRFPSSSFYALHWYRWEPAKSPQILFLFRSNGDEKEEGRVKATLDTKNGYSYLYIKGSQPEDSATYLCASEQNYNFVFGKGTQLHVLPNIQNATPAVYQLKSRKPNDTPICLFTDFDSKMNVSDVLNDTVISLKNTVVDMKTTSSKSNGVLFWSKTADSGCGGISDEISYHSSAGIPCDAKLIEKSFETDVNLNSQNLSVVAFRILFLKVAGFNLLMTLRLWSS